METFTEIYELEDDIMKGIIIAGGRLVDGKILMELFLKADLRVAADSGLQHLEDFGLIPDYLVGDIDSLEDVTILDRLPESVKVMTHPVEKDKTDTEIAADLLIDSGCTEITILGGTGSRLDHTLSNIQLLRTIFNRGVNGRIIDDNNQIIYLPREYQIKGNKDCYYSILPLGTEGIGVSLKGFHYPLDNVEIPFGSSLGISNYLEDNEGQIVVHHGEGILIRAKD